MQGAAQSSAFLCQLGACVCAEMGSDVTDKPSPTCKPAQDRSTAHHAFNHPNQ